MKRLLLTLGALALWTFGASAQVVPGAPQQVAIICASNTSPPAPTVGLFYLVQCDSTGKLLTNATGGGGGGTSSNFGAAFPAAGTAAGAEYLSSPPTLTTGQMVALQTDVNGDLKINIPDGLAVALGATTDGVWNGSGNSTLTQTERAIYNAVIAPITPCATSNCGGANPVGTVLVGGTLPAFTATPTVNLGTIGGVSTAANQATNNAQGAAIAGATGNLDMAEALTGDAGYTTATVNPLLLDLLGHLKVANGHLLLVQTPTVTSNGTYAAGKILGTLLTYSYTAAAATIESIHVTSSSQVTAGLTAWIFWQNPNSTTWTDNATPAIAAGDRIRVLAAVPLTPSNSLGTHTIWNSPVLDYNLSASTFFVLLVANGPSFTLTGASTSEINVRVGMRL